MAEEKNETPVPAAEKTVEEVVSEVVAATGNEPVAPAPEKTEQEQQDIANTDNIAKARAAIKNRGQAKPQEKPAEKPAEVPATPVVEQKPEEKGIQNELDEFLSGLKLEDETPVTEPVKETPTPEKTKDSFTLKDLAERFGVQANSIDELEKGLVNKMQRGYQAEYDLTKPVREIEQLLTADDKELVSFMKKQSGYTDPEITEYLDALEESQGKAGLKREALDYRAALRQEKVKIESNLSEQKNQAEQNASKQIEDIRSKILSMDKIAGIPLDKTANASFAEKFLKGDYESKLSDLQYVLEAVRFYEDREVNVKTLLEKGARSGFNKAKAIYESKFFNKDLNPGSQKSTFVPPASKPGDTTDNVTKAREFIRNRRGNG